MNDYISSNDYVVEIGSGAGFSRLYLKNNITITDTVLSPWIDKKIDALNMDFDDSSIDVIIASHTIHHFAYPYKFLIECLRVLKPSGKVIICDIYTGLFMRFILRLMRHEG